uniref:SPW repeat domain-containing protein n=2 Tax=Allokutzneria albata TaxID=211114 RepID=UPI0038995B72
MMLNVVMGSAPFGPCRQRARHRPSGPEAERVPCWGPTDLHARDVVPGGRPGDRGRRAFDHAGPWTRVQDWLALAAGVLLAPWLFSCSGNNAVTWTSWIVGVVVIGSALPASRDPRSSARAVDRRSFGARGRALTADVALMARRGPRAR